MKPTSKGGQPFQVRAINYITHLPTMSDRYIYLLIAIYVFSKWTEAINMKAKKSREVSEAIHHHIITRFGKPDSIRSNRGLEFAGEVSILCQELGLQ